MKSNHSVKVCICFSAMFFLAVLASGCSTGNPFSPKPTDGSQDTASSPKTKETTAVYLDFEDILIPLELTVDQNRTVIVSTPGFTSGILALKGRVDRNSLFNFFGTNMQKDNWNVISQIKSPGTTIMVFQKSSRTAVITIPGRTVLYSC